MLRFDVTYLQHGGQKMVRPPLPRLRRHVAHCPLNNLIRCSATGRLPTT